jgi:hypothetical protein
MAAGIRSLVPWYINSTPEGVWGFDLSKIVQPQWKERWLPMTTEFANNKKRTKLVGFLKCEDGDCTLIYEYKCNTCNLIIVRLKGLCMIMKIIPLNLW